MSKFLLAFFGLVMVIGSNAALAGHDALETLFENGSLSLASESNCEPYQSAEAPTKYAQILAQDIAWVINDMADKAIGVVASCDIVTNQKKMCKNN